MGIDMCQWEERGRGGEGDDGDGNSCPFCVFLQDLASRFRVGTEITYSPHQAPVKMTDNTPHAPF